MLLPCSLEKTKWGELNRVKKGEKSKQFRSCGFKYFLGRFPIWLIFFKGGWNHQLVIYDVYIYIYTDNHIDYSLNPNDPCFDWKKALFWRVDLQNRGRLGSRQIYLYIYIYISVVYILYVLNPFFHSYTSSHCDWLQEIIIGSWKAGATNSLVVWQGFDVFGVKGIHLTLPYQWN